MRYPPVKGWFVVNAHGHGIFCGLKLMGLFKVRKLSQDDEPSFHWQRICQPTVLRRWYVQPSLRTAVWSESRSAVSRRWWLVSESRRTYWFPSGSHWAYIDSAIKFAVRSVTSPSSKVTVYSRVSRMGVTLARPFGLPPTSLFAP